MQSAGELQANLREYRAQKEQVDELLQLDGSNEEYQDLATSLAEAIELTEEVLREAQQPATAVPAADFPGPSQAAGGVEAPVAVETAAPAVSSFLPPQVAEQIRAAQQKAALNGQAPAVWAIGARCQAVWSSDGQWYDALVDGVSAAGNFIVTFEEGGQEEVDASTIRIAPERDYQYRGVSAPTLKRVDDEPVVTEVPKWLTIEEGDDEKTRQKKKKLAKSYKSKMRFAKLDQETKAKQQSWKSFQKGKVSKKAKPKGFMTNMKKGSMFSVPEGGKVGVIGSGRGMTEYQDKGRHDFVAQQ